MAAAYDYLRLTLSRRPQPHVALSEALAAAQGRLARAEGEVVGQFAPQLGWANDEAAVLVRWRGQPAEAPIATDAALVTRVERRRLVPTLRPADGDALQPGGIYVHRWFEVEPACVDEFVALSGEGWKDFEPRFAAAIFGLFRQDTPSADVARLLLLTYYGGHDVWEASRDPSTEAMQIFARRQQLTKRTWAVSTRSMPAI